MQSARRLEKTPALESFTRPNSTAKDIDRPRENDFGTAGRRIRLRANDFELRPLSPARWAACEVDFVLLAAYSELQRRIQHNSI